MIFVKLAVFMLLINMGIAVVSLADIPENCMAFGVCENFAGTGESTWESSIKDEIDAGEYKSTQVESQVDQPLDLFNTVIKTLSLLGTLVEGTVNGGYYLTQFFLCGGNYCEAPPPTCTTDECEWNGMAIEMAHVMQIISYAIYLLALIQFIRGMNIEK